MTTRDDALSAADRRAFWRWVADISRPYIGWVLVALGVLAIFLGWYGVSGQSLTAKQLPYLVSGGVTGLALVLVGAVFLATDNVRRHIGRLDGIERKVDDLYALLVLEPSSGATSTTESATSTSDPTGLVALASGSTFHRAGCALVAGKADAVEVDAKVIAARALLPCPVCEAVPPGTSH